MANKLRVEAKVENLGNVYRIDAPFNRALTALRQNGMRKPISNRDLAYARIQEGKESSVCTDGSYTSAGFVYFKDSNPIFVLNSPLLNARLAEKATQANREGRYFSTNDSRIYEQCLKQAEKDKDLEPEKRKAQVLPSRQNFSVSMTENKEVMQVAFKDVAQEYLTFLEQEVIPVYLIDKGVVDTNTGTILTQAWLRGLVSQSGLDGDGGYLDYVDAVRGVRNTSASQGASVAKETGFSHTQYFNALRKRLVQSGVRLDKSLDALVMKDLEAN